MGRHPVAPAQLAVAAAALVLVPAARASGDACPDATLRPNESNLPRVEAALICMLNVERSKVGKKPVARDARLERSAARHTRDMVSRGYFAHQRRGGPTLLARIKDAGYFEGARAGVYSENLGYAPPERATAESMTRAFSLSESHRKTMLYGRFRDIGIGTTLTDPNPAFYTDYDAVVFTFDFGRRYERRRRCAHRPVARQSADSTRRSVPPRRWCGRRRAS